MVHHADKVGEVTLRVLLESDEFGREYFDYDSPREALAAVKRLTTAAAAETSRDGVERLVGIVVVPAAADFDGDDDWE